MAALTQAIIQHTSWQLHTVPGCSEYPRSQRFQLTVGYKTCFNTCNCNNRKPNLHCKKHCQSFLPFLHDFIRFQFDLISFTSLINYAVRPALCVLLLYISACMPKLNYADYCYCFIVCYMYVSSWIFLFIGSLFRTDYFNRICLYVFMINAEHFKYTSYRG